MKNPEHELGGYFGMELREGLQARKTIRGFPLNEFRSSREDINTLVSWIGFGD
jgi:hypothetical protein